MTGLDDDLFAGDALHEKEVEVAPGKKVTLHFRELPAAVFIKFHSAVTDEDENVRSEAAARLIADSVCNPDGSRAMTVEKALTLKTRPLNAMFSAIMALNAADGVDGAGKSLPSAVKNGSGTPSRSRSAKRSANSSSK